MKKIFVIGILGKDAEMVNYSGGSYLSFDVVENERTYNKNTGERKEVATWFYCVKFGENSGILPYLKKGTRVYIEGTPSARIYTKKNGEQSAVFEVKVYSLELLGGGNSGNKQNYSKAPEPPAQVPLEEPPF